MKSKHTKIIAWVIIVAMVLTSLSVVFFLPTYWGAESYVVYAATSSEEQKQIDQQLNALEEYIKFIHDNYKDPVDYQTLFDGAFSGAIDVLGDPYSIYFVDKEEADAFEEDVSGQFCGIGVTIENSDGKCKIVSAMKNASAEKAGIKTGDIIVEVDGKDVTKEGLNTISTMLRGKEGTTVVVTLDRNGQQLQFTLVRAAISLESVIYKMLEDDIGYMQVTNFDADSDLEFNSAITDLIMQGAKSVIIDIRDNPGGYISTAINMADRVLAKGNITTLTQKGKVVETYDASDATSLNLPIVLLVNEGSASAAEIFAAAIKDNNAATLVGETTYGKGVAQQIETLKSDSTLKLSVFYFITPKGDDIHEVGIVPNYVVRNTTGVDVTKSREAYNSFAPMSENEKPKAGDIGLNVYGAQQRLELLGFQVNVTGTMDDYTVKAVKEFQKEEGLYAYGNLDYTTMNRLNTATYNYANGISKEDKQLEKAIELLKK